MVTARQVVTPHGQPRRPRADFAWHVHSALESWGAKVDMKASILLAYQCGGFIFAVTSRDLVLGPWPGWSNVLILVALGLLLLAMGTVAAAIVPVLGSARRLRHEYPTNLIYFGHLRQWRPAELAASLTRMTATEAVTMLSGQLVALSQLSWRKYRLLQTSVLLTLLAMLVATLAIAGRLG